ncbi:MAG: CmpA/NrtA family ABC transporter substrate-binding protein, partial [Verrucomicrobiota bacterium]
MAILKPVPKRKKASNDMLRVGYVPLIDCAPLAAAAELGIFEKYDLRVTLHREPGWATIRDKILHGELEAAHALAGLTFALCFGLGAIREHCITGFIINSHGNAVTISKELEDAGVVDAQTAGAYSRLNKKGRPLVFAVVHAFSSHHFLMRKWLSLGGLEEGRDYELVIMPPQLAPRNLELGFIDGFCVGEPYNTIAQSAGIGQIVARSADLAPLHPEKALIVRRTFEEHQPEQHRRLILALHEACRFCADPENRSKLLRILAKPAYLSMPRPALKQSLEAGWTSFSGEDVNRPSREKAEWILEEMRNCRLLGAQLPKSMPKVDEIFREDL